VKAKRKQQLAKEIYYDGANRPYYDNLHQYSKNKIHCSCPACSAKTKNKGRKSNNYNPTHNHKISEKRKIMAMDYDKMEFYLIEEET
jgi:hypothetical protein